MTARVLMFQGTGSDVGKSLVVAGLCRLLANRGMSVRPFKPQNMSNNAAVTADGGEIGRAQALQARAARVAPSVDMNPVLLKPQSEVGSQIVVQGRVVGTAKAREYQTRKPQLMAYVLDSFAKLREQCDIVLVEGAGSASEVNLRANDIANMGFARAVDAPVVLIGDIDRGGVIASLCGTAEVVDPEDGKLIAGFIVNKMRGDPSLFASGMDFVAERTGWAPIGLVPHFRDAHRLPAEDVYGLEASPVSAPDTAGHRVRIVVPVLPHIANFDDLDPLRLGARRRTHSAAQRRAAAGRYGSGDSARLEGDHRGFGGIARLRMGCRYRCASSPWRARARPVRRLPDARPQHQRSRRH